MPRQNDLFALADVLCVALFAHAIAVAPRMSVPARDIAGGVYSTPPGGCRVCCPAQCAPYRLVWHSAFWRNGCPIRQHARDYIGARSAPVASILALTPHYRELWLAALWWLRPVTFMYGYVADWKWGVRHSCNEANVTSTCCTSGLRRPYPLC